jgi:hypothetical protein
MSAGRTGAARRDWRDTVRVAADLALLGLLVSAAALPVLTAGAAVATGSAAVHHYLEYDRWPGPALCRRMFRRRFLPGLAVTLAFVAAAVLVAVDLRALRSGWVPGGAPLIALTAVAAAAAVGYLGLVVVAAGAGWDARAVRPGTVAAMAGVVALAVVLAVLVHPVLVPVLAGYTIFALHVVARRRRGGVATVPVEEPHDPPDTAHGGRHLGTSLGDVPDRLHSVPPR